MILKRLPSLIRNDIRNKLLNVSLNPVSEFLIKTGGEDRVAMSVFILFGDGTAGRVVLTPSEYLPRFDNHPVQLVFLHHTSPGVSESFFRARTAAYNLLIRGRLVKAGVCCAFVCEVTDKDGKGVMDKIVGRSCELPFAVALITAMLKDRTKKITIGATGEISDIASGQIEPVDSVDAKLRGAINFLQPGSIIFYPSANKDDVSEDLTDIDTISVSTLREVMDHICQINPLKKYLHYYLSAVIIIGYFFFFRVSHPLSMYCLENGRYEFAQTYLSVANHIFFWDNRILELHNGIRKTVNPCIAFHYTLFQSGQNVICPVRQMPNHLSLMNYDSYAFHITPSEPLYFYIYQKKDGPGEIRVLFPCPYWSSYANPLESAKKYKIPESGSGFSSGGYKGAVETYIIASRWRCLDIEKIFASVRCKVWVPEWRTKELHERSTLRDRQGRSTVMERTVFWHN